MFFSIFKRKKKLTDLELVAAYKKDGDLFYVAELHQRYGHFIAGLSYKYLNSKTDAEDASMEVFEIISKDLLKHDVKNFNNWLFSVTKNHCLKKKRKDSKYIPINNDENYLENIMENDHDIDLIKEKEDKELIYNAMDSALKNLKPEQKQCVELFYLKEKSYKEIVEITGYDEKKVKSYIQNGKRKLKIELEK